MTTPKTVAFPVRASGDGVERPFPSLAAVQEPDDEKYLDRVRVTGDERERWADVDLGKIQDQPDDLPSVRAERRTQKFLDLFFAKEESAIGWHNVFGSVTKEMKRVFAVQQVRERITLELRFPIPTISPSGDEPGFFLYCDDKLKVADAARMAPHDWLDDKATKLIGYWSGDAVEKRGALRSATARILVNVRKSEERKLEPGHWNNVIPYGASKQFYGRNFAIATGRKYVLYPTGSGQFDPIRDFTYYKEVTPTEHIFLTIHPLVKTPWGVVDAFSDEEVNQGDIDAIRKITGLEWKKVVLFYALVAPKGAAPRLVQLKRCLIDGIDTPVVAVPTEASAAS
jgi:hypothetical protein